MPHLSDTPLTVPIHHTHGMRWHVVPEWEATLLDAKGLRLDQWLCDGQAQVVKKSAGRTIYRVDLDQKSLYLKHYRGGLRERLRQWFRTSAACREWHKTLELRRRRVPTVRPVAYGESPPTAWWREQYFLTEAIGGGQSLADLIAQGLLARSEARSLRRKLIDQVARLIAATHQAGVVHDDLHAGNILVADPYAAEIGLYLIDVPKVRFTRPLDWPASRDNLAILYSGHLGQLSRGEVARFWRVYRQSRPELQLTDPISNGRELVQCAWEHARRIAQSRDKRALANNRDFYRLATRSVRGWGVSDLPRSELAHLLADPEHRLAAALHQPLKLAHGSVVVESWLELSSGRAAIAYKRYRPKTWLKQLQALIRPSRARQSWICGHALLARGIATPRPLMACETFGAGPRVSYLATAWIDGALNLHTYAWKLAASSPIERLRRTRNAARSAGKLIGRMHAWQISHHDLKGCNLLLAERGAEVDAFVIDLDGVGWHRQLSRQQATSNLARLSASIEAHPWLTRTDRLRFLLAYLQTARRPASEWKTVWREVAPQTAKIAARLARNGGLVA